MNAPQSNRVRIVLPLGITPFFHLLNLALGFKAEAIKNKGQGRVFRGDSAIQVCLEGLTEGLLDDLVNSYLATQLREGVQQFNLTRIPFDQESSVGIVAGECFEESLSKKFLTTMPTGVWLVSTARDGYGEPWSVNLTPQMDRQRVWERAQEVGANGRKIYAVWRKDDAEAIIRQL